MNKHDMRIQSSKFPGHYYELLDQLGNGGNGAVYSVKLCENETGYAKNLYACKIVYE